MPGDRGGVGRYVEELAPELVAAGVHLVLVCQRREVDHFRRVVPGARVVAAPAWAERVAARLVWEQLGLPLLARRQRVDLVHSPHYTMPLLSPVPVVVTLHDGTFFSHPEVHSRAKRVFFRTWTRVSLRRAAGCVTPSAATRDALREAVDGRAPVTVAHLGVDARVFRKPDAASLEALRRHLDLGADETHVAFLGTLEPRKNVPALVRAWVRACQGRERPPTLVLAGGPGWDTAVGPAIAEVPPGLRVLRPGYLPVELLAPLLGGAAVVAYPSLGEGFGLPVLEAMACGAAVLTSRELSLPEVGGDAVAYTDTDETSIGAALSVLLDDPVRRADLASRGTVRSRDFTWRNCALRHVSAYDAALRKSSDVD